MYTKFVSGEERIKNLYRKNGFSRLAFFVPFSSPLFAYKRFLKVDGAKSGIDQKKIKEEEMYDSKYVIMSCFVVQLAMVV